MKYPLMLSFKFFAFAPQIYVKDADRNDVAYVHQKLFKLREKVNIFNNKKREQILYTLQADRIIDFSAKYYIRDAEGTDLCYTKQYGWRSIWRTHFDIFKDDKVVFRLREENPWVKMGDVLLGFIPFFELLGGLLFNPSYLLRRVNADGTDGEPVMRVVKKPSFVERLFAIRKLADFSDEDEKRLIPSVMMMVLLERNRG